MNFSKPRSNFLRTGFTVLFISFFCLPLFAFASTIVPTISIISDTTWDKAGSPYILAGFVSIQSGGQLTINPGTIIKSTGFGILSRGTLNILGTEEEPVYFTALEDDTIGGDSNSDGNVSVPHAGSWYLSGYTGAEININNFFGYYSDDIYVYNTPVTFLNARIATTTYGVYMSGNKPLNIFHSSFSGIERDEPILSLGSGTTTIENSTFAFGSDVGISMTKGGALFISSSTISNFEGAGIFVNRGDLNIQNSTIENNYYGVLIRNLIPVLIKNNILNFGTKLASFFFGAVANADDTPILATIKNSVFKENITGVRNEKLYGVVDARENFWNDSSGPYHFSLNPIGKGDRVEGNVLISPWLLKNPFALIGSGLQDCCSSVAFIPGIKASRLYLNKNGSENKLWEPNRTSDVEKLFMDQNGNPINAGIYTRDVVDEIKVGVFNTGSNIYKGFLDFMDNMVAQGDIIGFKTLPYDWRFSPEQVVRKGVKTGENVSYENVVPADQLPFMVAEIEKLAEGAQNGKVAIVAHSNGGLVTKALIKYLEELKTEGKSDLIDKIDRVILVASPELGTPQTVTAMLHGEGEDILKGMLLDKEVARNFTVNLPGAYTLLPSDKYFNKVNDSVASFNPSVSNVWDFSAYGSLIQSFSVLKDFLLGNVDDRPEGQSSDIKTPLVLNSNLLNSARDFHTIYDDFVFPETIKVDQIVGWGLDTVKAINYFAEEKCSSIIFCNKQYVLEHTLSYTKEGDGTVVYPSGIDMAGEDYYLDIRRYNEEAILNREHGNITEILSVRSLIKNLVTEKTETLDYVIETKPTVSSDDKTLLLSVHSPISISAYDQFGNHTGLITNPNPDSDIVLYEEKIPNSSYSEIGEGKYLNLDSNQSYTIKMQGNGFGTFTFKKEEILSNGDSTVTTFADLLVTPETIAEVSTVPDLPLTEIKLDVDGDGAFDQIINANQVFDPVSYLISMKFAINNLNLPDKFKPDLIKEIDKLIKDLSKEKIEKIKKQVTDLIKKLNHDIAKENKKDRGYNIEEINLVINMFNQLLNNLK